MILRGVVFSQTLEMDTGITIVTGKAQTGTPYKVIYMLHGLCGANSNWTDNTMLNVYAAEYNAIFVMPDAVRSFYADMVYGQKYFTYITEELPKIVRETFNISTSYTDTAIFGNSLGGYGALKAALNHPDRYSYCAAFSPGCLFMGEFLQQLRENKGSGTIEAIYGKQFITDFLAAYGENFAYNPSDELLYLADKVQNCRQKPKLYVACGTRDYLYSFNIRFKEAMEKIKMDYTFEQWPAEHNWYFFNQALKKALENYFAIPG